MAFGPEGQADSSLSLRDKTDRLRAPRVNPGLGPRDEEPSQTVLIFVPFGSRFETPAESFTLLRGDDWRRELP
jgi:hypothetical protein